jgi:hypothetical protein
VALWQDDNLIYCLNWDPSEREMSAITNCTEEQMETGNVPVTLRGYFPHLLVWKVIPHYIHLIINK